MPFVFAAAAGALAGTLAFLVSRSFWVAVLVGFAFTVLYLLPFGLAWQSSRQMTEEQKERWGLTVKMTPEQRAHARRLSTFLFGSKLLLFGTLAAAAYALDSPLSRIAAIIPALLAYLFAVVAGHRSARKHLPQPSNAWVRRAHRTHL